MKQSGCLTGILVGIGVLVAGALIVLIAPRGGPSYFPDDTPDGVAYNYAQAVDFRDYRKAFGYLADLAHKPSYEQFRDSFFHGAVNPPAATLNVVSVEIDGDDALLGLILVYSSGPSGRTYRAHLVRQNGAWKLKSMPTYYFWDASWYQEQPK